MRNKNFLTLAIEDLVEEQNNELMQNIDNNSNSTIEHFDNVTQAEDQIDQHLDQINITICDVNDVDQINDFTQSCADEGGLDSTTAQILDVATESLYNRLGIKPDSKQYASEDFGSTKSKIQASSVSLEGFKDFITNMWEAIKSAFKKMGMYLKHYLSMVFGLNTKNIRQANDLKAQLNKKPISKDNKAITGEKPVIEMNSYFVSFVKNKNSENLLTDLTNSLKTIDESFAITNSFCQFLASSEDLRSLIKDEKSLENLIFPNLSEKLSPIDEKSFVEATNKQVTNKDLEFFKSQDMVGSKAIYISLPKGFKEMKAKATVSGLDKVNITLGYTRSDEKDTSSDKYKVQALGPMSHQAMISAVLKVSELVSSSERSLLDIVNRHDKLISEISSVEQMLGVLDENNYEQYRLRVKLVRSLASSVNRLSAESVKVVSGSVVKSCHVILSYTTQSYRAYLKSQ